MKSPARSRQACTNCRRSKVKCDEQKPSCTRCWQKDLKCINFFQLKWESDFRERGVAFGRSGVGPKNPKVRQSATGPLGSSTPSFPKDAFWLAIPEVEPWTFVNNDISLIRRLFDEEQDRAEPHLWPAFDAKMAIASGEQGPWEPVSPFSSSLYLSNQSMGMTEAFIKTLRPSLPLFPSLDETRNRVLFDYYINQICPRTVHSSLSQSPFASVILPYCVSASPTVLRAIQALAACHWSHHDSQYTNIALQLKSQVLNDLQKRMNIDHRILVMEDPEVLVIVMFLCLFDIVDNCNQQWIVHLQGAKDIIRLRKQDKRLLATEKTSQSPVSSFAELFFAFQDVMGRTACAKADLFGSNYWHEDDKTINPWMGCSSALVSLLFSVMDLSQSRRLVVSDEEQADFSVRAATLSNKLEALEQEAPCTDETDQLLPRIAELRKLTCVVYLHCALYGGRPTDYKIKGYVREILREIVDLLALGSACHLIWPLFVAAVELDPLDNELWLDPKTGLGTDGRRLVLDLLARMAKSSVSSVSRTRMVIEHVWKSRDFSLSTSSEPPRRASGSDLNDWEQYVVPPSDALSLV